MEKTRYIVEYEPGIEEKLRKLPKFIRERIRDAIEKRLMVAPLAYGKPLQHNLKGRHRIRVGDYRIVYRVFEEKVLVLIVEVDHRKDIYE